MAAIKGKDTKPEKMVRQGLWRRGFRYRLCHPRLPGKPDVVLTKYRTCIFVNGCFWHGHFVEFLDGTDAEKAESSACCKIPKTNRAFWVNKMRRNQERDKGVTRRLAEMGWHSITIWECELKPAVRERTLDRLVYTLSQIYLHNHAPKRYDMPEDTLPQAAEYEL